MNKTKSQSGSVHLIIIAILSIALIGTLGFVFYQNFIQNKDSTTKTNEVKTTTKTETTAATKTAAPTIAPGTVVSDFVTSYLSYMASPRDGHYDLPFALQSSVVTDGLKARLSARTLSTVDAFLLVNGAMPSGFTIGNVVTTASKSSVTVNFVGPTPQSGSHEIFYNLVLVDNEWKIDEVVESN